MIAKTLPQAFVRNFLGHAPAWYKLAVFVALVANPLLLLATGPMVAGWCVVLEFIFTLAMALKCYPLLPGGLLALEAVLLNLTDATSVYGELVGAMPVLLLLVFMVAGIFFLRELLLSVFTNLLLRVHSQTLLALLFCAVAALLSAFLDALTVVAALVTIGIGFYQIYHRAASESSHNAVSPSDRDGTDDGDSNGDFAADTHVAELHRSDLDQFRAFLRGLMMHALVGTALGGVITQVGEPQNLLIATQADWNFTQFFMHTAPASLTVLAVGLITCVLLDRSRWFGYGTPLPAGVLSVLREHHVAQLAKHSAHDRAVLVVQTVVALLLVLALGFHVAEVGLIGLAVIVLATSFNGVIEEQRIGKAFETALPFTALLVAFFAIVAAIHDQHLFEALIAHVLSLQGKSRIAMLYVANGVLSAISDNVFVATIYIHEIKAAFLEGLLTRAQFEQLAVAVNIGTNIPSVATPNGQAAFLFLLTSTLAPLLRLSYGRMIWMALPYTIALSIAGIFAVVYFI